MEYEKELIERTCSRNALNEIDKHSYRGYVELIDKSRGRVLRSLLRKFGPFVVKTHCGPTPTIKKLISSGLARASFCFRDPRDVALSVLDHADRTRRGLDASGAFANVHTLSDAIEFSSAYIDNYFAWREFGKALFIKYEDLMADKPGYLDRIANYFGFPVTDDALVDIFEKHERLKKQAWNFNKGLTERWRSEMTTADLALCKEVFGDRLTKMGYSWSGKTL
jgi:hypothetical protein